jgi:hypothetical protein
MKKRKNFFEDKYKIKKMQQNSFLEDLSQANKLAFQNLLSFFGL